MYKRIKGKIAVFGLIMALMINSIAAPMKVQAALPIAIGAWEILQMILLSAGVTIGTAELVDHVLPEGWEDDVMSAVSDVMNDFKDGLGTAVNEIAAAAVSAGNEAVTVAKDTWDSLRSWATSLAASGEVITLPGIGVSVELSSVDEVYNMLGISGYQINDTYNNTRTGVENFLKFAAAYEAPISCIKVVYDPAEPLTSSKYYFVFTESGSTHSITFDEEFDSWWTYVYLDNGATFCVMEMWFYVPYTATDSSQGYYDGSFYSSSQKFIEKTRFDSKVSYPQQSYSVVFQNSSVDIALEGTVSSVFEADIASGVYDVVTPGRTVAEDGTLAGDMVITFPADMDVAAALDGVRDGTQDPAAVLEDVGVIPVDITDTDTVTDVVASAQAKAQVDDYNMTLWNFFPFCIPYDFANFIGVLQAEPEAPKFTFELPTGYLFNESTGVFEVQWSEYTIDFAMFDEAASVLRTFELLLFIVGLIYSTRNVFIRG